MTYFNKFTLFDSGFGIRDSGFGIRDSGFGIRSYNQPKINNNIMNNVPPNFIVGIGGSAGGLNAYKALLEALPSDTGMALVFVSHMLPEASSQLAYILSRHTKMPAMVATNAMGIWANHIYVIAPNADISIKDSAFEVISPRIKRNTQIDIFFTSLAKAMGKRAIGIILSGYDGDGTKGCKQIKANGGHTFAQDNSAEINHMSISAQSAGCVDFVLSPKLIAEELVRLSNSVENTFKN